MPDICNIPLVDKVCDVVDAIDFVTDPGGAITDGIGAWIARSAGELAASAAELAARAVDATTRVDLTASWFKDNYELLLPIGLTLTVATFILQLVRAAWRRDERALVQAASGTMIGVLFAFSAIALTTVALTVVDALSAGLFQAANSSVDDAIRRVVQVSQYGAMFELGWLVPTFVAIGAAIGAFLYWAVMVARKVGILILVSLAVFAGAGGGWEVARKWRRGWIEATATLIVSKLLMTIVFLIGVSAMGKSEPGDGLAALSDAMAGIVVLVLVLLCPYITYKFVHWASDGGDGGDMHRSGVAGLAVAAGAGKTAGMLAFQARAGGRAPQGPATVAGQGAGGIAAGIKPSNSGPAAGAAPQEPAQTHFRFGEDPKATGDKGRALIQRPPTSGDRGRPLIRRPGQGAGAGGAATAEGPSGGTPAPPPPPASTARVAPPAPRDAGPPPQGGSSPGPSFERPPNGGAPA
ncbi:SCO6881 family protein [Streptomyces otsuchiensis]|uniref:SCO6881 family protein n=1 Tax=Streptomyces otsuchiensis TaxID=2681388 RepID=UPI00103078A3|nr:ATP-binding protein [Streptomyces otsuchiensis]